MPSSSTQSWIEIIEPAMPAVESNAMLYAFIIILASVLLLFLLRHHLHLHYPDRQITNLRKDYTKGKISSRSALQQACRLLMRKYRQPSLATIGFYSASTQLQWEAFAARLSSYAYGREEHSHADTAMLLQEAGTWLR